MAEATVGGELTPASGADMRLGPAMNDPVGAYYSVGSNLRQIFKPLVKRGEIGVAV